MNRKVFYVLYVLISTAINILFTAVIIGALFGICFVVLYFAVKAGPEMYANALFGSFTVGLVLSFFLYSKITTKVIKKYGFDEKFGRVQKRTTVSEKKDVPAKKTVLPSSVLEDEEDEKWRE